MRDCSPKSPAKDLNGRLRFFQPSNQASDETFLVAGNDGRTLGQNVTRTPPYPAMGGAGDMLRVLLAPGASTIGMLVVSENVP